MAILALLVLVGCTAYGGTTTAGYPMWKGDPVSAIATPWGPLYFGDAMNDPRIRRHEGCHIQRMQQMGALNFMLRYVTDAVWACREERICGWHGPHPNCQAGQ
jgi:hypothetical protein